MIIQDIGSRFCYSGFLIQSNGFRVCFLGFRFCHSEYSLGFRYCYVSEGSGFVIQGMGFKFCYAEYAPRGEAWCRPSSPGVEASLKGPCPALVAAPAPPVIAIFKICTFHVSMRLSKFRVQGSGFRVWGLGLRIEDSALFAAPAPPVISMVV